MSALSQRKAWHCVGLQPVERLALFCLAQRGGKRDIVAAVELEKMARRCCVGPGELRGVLLALHGRGHVTVLTDWSVRVHPVVPQDLGIMVAGTRNRKREAMECLTTVA